MSASTCPTFWLPKYGRTCLPADSLVAGGATVAARVGFRASACCDRARGSSHLAIYPQLAPTLGHVPGRGNRGESW